MATPSERSEPLTDSRRDLTRDTFCIYCQREYANHANLVRHIARKHPGTYTYNAYVGTARDA